MWSLWRLLNLKVTHILCAVYNTIAQSILCSLPSVANYEATFLLDLCFQFGEIGMVRVKTFLQAQCPPGKGKGRELRRD